MTNQPVGHLVALIDRIGDREFIIDASTDVRLSGTEFKRAALGFSRLLQEGDVNPGDRVALLLPNSAEYAVSYVATILAGAECVPLNPNLSLRDAQFVVETSLVRHLVTSSTHSEIADVLPVTSRFAVRCGCESSEVSGQKKILSLDDVSLDHADGPKSASTDIAAIMYTSGTTARPKGVAHRLSALLRNAEAFVEMIGLDEESRFLNVLPMAYMAGFLNLTLVPLVAGGSVVIAPAFNARTVLDYWSIPETYGVNALWFTPTMLTMLLRGDRGESGKQHCSKHVRHAFVGTAPLSPATREAFEQRYDTRLYEGYGLSETLFVTNEKPGSSSSTGSTGRPIPGVDVRIEPCGLSVDGHESEGEIVISSPDIMVGYVDSETGRIDRRPSGEPFATGDIGHMDERGELHITGRKKDLIIRGGVNVSPRAIEDVIQRLSGIEDVAVVGYPHEIYGEDVAAVIVLKAGRSLDEIQTALTSQLRVDLAAHELPSVYLEIEALPMSATGKIHKQRLREYVANKLHSRRGLGA